MESIEDKFDFLLPPYPVAELPTIEEGVKMIEQAQVALGNAWSSPATGFGYSLEEAVKVWRAWCSDPRLSNITALDSRFTVRFLKRPNDKGDVNFYERWIVFFNYINEEARKKVISAITVPQDSLDGKKEN